MPRQTFRQMEVFEVEVWMKRLSALSIDTQVTRLVQELKHMGKASMETKKTQLEKIDTLVAKGKLLITEIEVLIVQLHQLADELESKGV